MKIKYQSILLLSVINLAYADFQKGLDEYHAKRYEPAFSIFKTEAEVNNDADAQYFLGHMYLSGEGTIKSTEKAISWLKKASEAKNEVAMYELAQIYLKDRDANNDNEANHLMEKSAELNHPGAQFFLAVKFDSAYQTNKKDHESQKKAFFWLEKAVENNSQEAKYVMAQFYLEGADNIEKNTQKAIELLKSNVKYGHLKGALQLAKFYLYGKFVEKNVAEGLSILGKCVVSRDPEAMLLVAGFLESGEFASYGLKVDMEKSARLLKDLADDLADLRISAEAQAKLGIFFFKGLGVKQSDEDAYFWLKQAQKNGYNVDDKTLTLIFSLLNTAQKENIEKRLAQTDK